MIASLTGTLAAKTANAAVIEVQGVGYEVGMSEDALSKLPALGEPLQLQTHLHVRDDALALFGFLTIEEKLIFEQLISVAGVGPKVALAALSVLSPHALAQAIASQDVATVQRIPGVGKKTASRIILELKGSLDGGMGGLFKDKGADVNASAQAALSGARDALLSMGFTAAEAELALKDAPSHTPEAGLLQYGLKRLGSSGS